MSNPLLTKTYQAGAAIAAYRIVKMSAAETVIQAAAVSDVPIGISTDIAPASGERVDVVHAGVYFVTAGAAFSIGARLTSDGTGRAVAAAPAAGTNNGIIGIAIEAAAAAGDVCRIVISPGTFQG